MIVAFIHYTPSAGFFCEPCLLFGSLPSSIKEVDDIWKKLAHVGHKFHNFTGTGHFDSNLPRPILAITYFPLINSVDKRNRCFRLQTAYSKYKVLHETPPPQHTNRSILANLNIVKISARIKSGNGIRMRRTGGLWMLRIRCVYQQG